MLTTWPFNSVSNLRHMTFPKVDGSSFKVTYVEGKDMRIWSIIIKEVPQCTIFEPLFLMYLCMTCLLHESLFNLQLLRCQHTVILPSNPDTSDVYTSKRAKHPTGLACRQ